MGPTLGFNGTLNIIGDVTGQFTGDAGMVQLTAYTTNDKTAPSGTTLLNLNGKSNLAFSNIMFVGGNVVMINATTLTSQNVSFKDCAFIYGNSGTQSLLNASCAFATKFNWLFDRCVLHGLTTNCISVTFGSGIGQDYDANFTVDNCMFLGGSSLNTLDFTGTAGTNTGGGGTVRNCFIVNEGGVAVKAANQNSARFPLQVYNCFLATGAQITLAAQVVGQLIEDYNLIVATIARNNVAIGTHSISDTSYAPLFHFGQERIWGGLLRPFGEPMANSPLLGFGNDGAQTPYDLFNRPRPAGGGTFLPAVGALERGNTAVQATSPAPPSGTYSWKFTGPGYQDLQLPVSNVSTTIAVSVQRDTSYATTGSGLLPTMELLADPALGLGTGPPGTVWQTITDTGAAA